jgi:hypothetical protein
MPLLNYTTEVDADKSAQEIAKMLSRAGAKAVLTEYDEEEGYVTAISFKIKLNGQDVAFRLPCDWKPVFEVMYKDKKSYSSYDSRFASQQSSRRAQAIRTAWRIVKDWTEAQLAIIETRMVKTEQVFLPYAIMRDNKTLYEHVESNPQFLLGDGQ